jgi:N-acetylmuramoyl-L-alanine amidase
MVPVDFFTVVVPKLTLQAVEYPMGSNRIFIGGIKPNSFSVRLDPLANGARLTVQFTDKVAVRTAASNGKWIMFLGDNPTGPLESSFRFQDPYISELQFDDQDGVPKLVLTPTETGLNFYPVLAESGKVLLADVLKPPPAVASQSGPAQPSATVPSPSAATGAQEAIPATPPGPPLPIVVLDAGHGGSDVGGRSSEGVMEKDLVAQVVARVRLALLATQKYRILLTRPSDVDTTFEQRSTAANVARAAYFLTFHAGDLGPASPRIGVYTYHPPSPSALAVGDTPQSVFIPWTQVQESHLEESRQFAEALQQQLARIPGTTVDAPQGAPVRALRSVNAPAVAIELGRLSPEAAAGPLVDPNFQQQVAAAVAQVLGGMRGGA